MSNDYKIYTSYESLIEKLENNGIELYIKWLDDNKIRINTPITWGKIMVSSLCVAVQFHHMDLLKYIIKNDGDINGIMDNCISHYTPLSAIYLIDQYYISHNKSIDKKLQSLTNKQIKKLLTVKNEIFELLILSGADINLLGLNGQNLLGLELRKPITHIIPEFIGNIIRKGLNPNINNFVTNKEIPFSFDSKAWMTKRKILHFMVKGNQALVIDLAWSVKPLIILIWSIIITYIISKDDGSGDIFGLYLDISGLIFFIKQICPQLPEFLLIDHIKSNGFKIGEKELVKKSVQILKILINGGTNLKEKQSNGKNIYETVAWFKNDCSMFSNIFKKYGVKTFIDIIMKGIDRNISKVLGKHAKKDVARIEQLGEIFKISLKNKNLNDKIVRKNVCNTIKFLNRYGKNIEPKFYNIILNLNDTCSNNEKILVGDDIQYYNNDEIFTYPSNIIKGNKKQKLLHSFHVSEIPDLIRTGKNPYNREKFSKEILKGWYDRLSDNKLPSTLAPVSLKEIHQFNFDELILSRNPGILIKNEEIDVYNFNDIPDIKIRKLFKKNYKPGLSLNLVVNNIANEKNLGVRFVNIFKSKKYIKSKKQLVKITKNIEGYGIYDKKYNIRKDFKKIERWANYTSIGRYFDLIKIIDKWSYPMIYNFLIILANYRQPIITINNWKKLIHNFWKKRKIYTLKQMNNFFHEIFFHIIISGCNSGKLNLSFALGIITQLNSEFEMIEKLKDYITKNYDKKDLVIIFKDLEDQNVKLLGLNSIQAKYPLIIKEILSMFEIDENAREIFSLGSTFDQQWKIINSENPELEYFLSTMEEYDRIFMEIRWGEYSKEEKEPFIEAIKIIKNTVIKNINNVWKDKIQDLLYLLTPHKGVYNVRQNYIIF